MNDPFVIFMIILSLGSSFLGIWFLFIRPYREARAKQRQAMAQMPNCDEDFSPTLEEYRVTLVKKVCGTKMVGTKYVECRCEYWLFFKDEFEREIPLSVEEEIYLAIEEGDSGILALSDGKLYSFTLDE